MAAIPSREEQALSNLVTVSKNLLEQFDLYKEGKAGFVNVETFMEHLKNAVGFVDQVVEERKG